MRIPVHIINRYSRSERRASILKEFADKPLFDLTIHEPIYHPIGSYSHWKTFRQIIMDCKNEKVTYFVFCEDDHTFTEHFSESTIIPYIQTADRYHADILLGGVSWFDFPIQCTENLFYVEQFNGMQFSVIFSSAFDKILAHADSEEIVTDICLSHILNNIFVIWTFISIQKEFGYSDITSSNSIPNRVSYLFQKASRELSILNKVNFFYNDGE